MGDPQSRSQATTRGLTTIRRALIRGSFRRQILLAIAAVNLASIVVAVAFFQFYARERRDKLKEMARLTRAEQQEDFREIYLSFFENVLPSKVPIPELIRLRTWGDMQFVRIMKLEPGRVFIDPKGGRGIPADLDVDALEQRLVETADQNRELQGPGHGLCLPFRYRKEKPWGAIYLLPKETPPPDLPEAPYASLFMTLVAGTVLSIFVTYVLLSRLVLAPLDHLVASARRLARGDYDTETPPTHGRSDEVGRLGLAIAHLRGELATYRDDMTGRVDEALARARASERSLAIADRLTSTGKLAAGFAHEINNPLGGMLNMARRLRSGGLDAAKQEQYLTLIEEGLRRIEGTVGQFIRSSPRQAVEPVAVRVIDPIESAAALAAHRAKHVTVTFDLDVDRRLEILADRGSLQQIFLNLYLNAIDAMPEGGRLTTRGRRLAGDVEIEVEDTGVGMTEAELAHAFDLFYTTKKQGEGTGLGLSVVHNLVRDLDGSIDVTSRPGQGTRFTLRFPAMDPNAS